MEGDRIEKKALDILVASGELQNLARSLQQEIQGHVRLGINAGPDYLKIPDVISLLFQKFPGIRLEIFTSSTGEILKQIQTGTLDCGFVFGSRPDNGVESIFLSPVDLEIDIPMGFKANLSFPDLKALAVSVLEKSEAKGFAKRRKVFFWPGEEKFKSTLSFAYSRERADDRLLRTVAACLMNAWNAG